MLEGSFVWEARSLIFVAVMVPVYMVSPPVGLAIGGLATLAIFIMVRPRIYPSSNQNPLKCLNHIILRTHFFLAGTGHNFFVRGDRAFPPTYLQSLG